MAVKYYRVKQDTFLWEKGAILSSNSDGYVPTNEVWNKFEDQNEYISHNIVEKNPDWFERVYPINLLSKVVYKLRAEAKEHIAKEHTD